MPDHPAGQFVGDLALVTGGARGLGAAMAEELGTQGARVVIADLDATACEERAGLLQEKGIDASYVVMDVADISSVERAAARVQANQGDVSVLINNAGTSGFGRVGAEGTLAEWTKIIDVNLQGVFHVIDVFLEQLKRTRGRIVSVSSVAGMRSGFSNAAYPASKGGVRSLTQHLARELAEHGIRVNAVAPGYFDSGLGMKGNATADAWINQHCPMKRYGDPHEIAGPVAFLASPKASFVTGVTLPVDGGYLVI